MKTKIGIFGNGQLGAMLAEAAREFDAEIHFFADSPTKTCAGLGEQHLGSIYTPEDVAKFIKRCDVITFESENTDTTPLQAFDPSKFSPSLATIKICQDRLYEKQFVRKLNLKTAPFESVSNGNELHQAASSLGFRGILKTRTLGYDGKGQWRFCCPEDVAEICANVDWSSNRNGYIVEGFVEFKRELSIIGARSRDGSTAFLPVAENVHQHGMLIRSQPIGQSDAALQFRCESLLAAILKELDYCGTLAVELFDCDGDILVNELAPRVHNSGHWSIEGYTHSQFQLHIAAILGKELHAPVPKGFSCMYNVIGNHLNSVELSLHSNIFLHDYHKESRKNRKLGHVTVVTANEREMMDTCRSIESAIASSKCLPVK